jgi:hypothetical protein
MTYTTEALKKGHSGESLPTQMWAVLRNVQLQGGIDAEDAPANRRQLEKAANDRAAFLT